MLLSHVCYVIILGLCNVIISGILRYYLRSVTLLSPDQTILSMVLYEADDPPCLSMDPFRFRGILLKLLSFLETEQKQTSVEVPFGSIKAFRS